MKTKDKKTDFDQINREAKHHGYDRVIADCTNSQSPSGSNRKTCPVCDKKTYFRISNYDECGAVICANGCSVVNGKETGDIIGSVAWLNGITNLDAAKLMAEKLGISSPVENSTQNTTKKNAKSSTAKEPATSFIPITKKHPEYLKLEKIALHLLDDVFFQSMGLDPAVGREKMIPQSKLGIVKLGSKTPKHSDLCIGVPRLNEKDEPSGTWLMMRLNGKKFSFGENKNRGCNTSAPNNFSGYSGSLEGSNLIYTEGESDLMALNQVMCHDDYSAFTTGGTASKLPPWLINRVKDKTVTIIYDNAKQAQKDARAKAAKFIKAGVRCRVVELPNAKDGDDLRDWLSSPGCDWPALFKAIQDTKTIEPVTGGGLDPYDYFRLAIGNLDQYQKGGRKLIHSQGRWYRYKGTHYVEVGTRDLKIKLRQFLQAEFKRLHENDVENWTGNGDPPEYPKMVSSMIVKEVLESTMTLCTQPSSVEYPCLLDDPEKTAENYIAMRNGIIDISQPAEDFDTDKGMTGDYLMPHTPNFFSTICLDYEFQGFGIDGIHDTTFYRFLLDSFPGQDGLEYISTLQEFLGYLLIQDSRYAKMLVMHGEGANGKSVFSAIVKALLGRQNCAASSLDRLANRFEAANYHHKSCNIIDEASTIDQKTQDYMKLMISGGDITVEEKYEATFTRPNTCRLLMLCNRIPRFRDDSDGMYRRLLVVPWRIQVPLEKQRAEFVSIDFWRKSGEMPLIFAWAFRGMLQLRRRGRFLTTPEMDADARRATQSGSLIDFIKHEVIETDDDSDFVFTWEMHERYADYCKRFSIRPEEYNPFTKVVGEVLKRDKADRKRVNGKRQSGYIGYLLKSDYEYKYNV